MESRRKLSRSTLALLHDIFMAAASFVIAFAVRLEPESLLGNGSLILQTAFCAMAVGGVVFILMGLYRGIWRYASIADLSRIVQAAFVTTAGVAIALFFLNRLEDFPRMILIIAFVLMVFLLGGTRLAYRSLKDRGLRGVLRSKHGKEPIIVIGADAEADAFIRRLKTSSDTPYTVASLVSLDPRSKGSSIQGVRVDGSLRDLQKVIHKLVARGIEPKRFALSPSALEASDIDELIAMAGELGMSLDRIPTSLTLQSGLDEEVRLRPVAIEDLLGRPQTKLDRSPLREFLAGKRVLVTGAGGSIGSELVRQIASYGPSELTLLDASEFALYKIDIEISERYPSLNLNSMIGDVRDTQRIEDVFGRAAPEIVLHAAALKHVPLVEANPNEAILTNAIGTRNVADACLRHRTKAMVLISTDKAVNPANVMGATKRLAESYCQALDLHSERRKQDLRFVTVRFGNVLGSTGSVVPRFRQQLERGGPLTITHPNITRYFMTISEAVELVLHAGEIGSRGSAAAGKIFVLDMGAPVRIIDLAKRMIELSGLKVERDIKIEITGLRPGEKLYEELLHDGEEAVPTERAGITLAQPRTVDYRVLEAALKKLQDAAQRRDRVSTLRLLKELVPEFTHEHEVPQRGAKIVSLPSSA